MHGTTDKWTLDGEAAVGISYRGSLDQSSYSHELKMYEATLQQSKEADSNQDEYQKFQDKADADQELKDSLWVGSNPSILLW